MRPVEPLGFFTHGALVAGWYICWRLTLFTAPFWAGALLAGAGLVYLDETLAPIAALLALAGFVGAFIASIPVTNRIARAWSLAWFGQRLVRGVWWGIFWRVLIVSFVAGIAFGAVQAAAALYAATMEWSPVQLFVTMIPYAVLVASLVITLRSYGWAMSEAVVRRLGGPVPAPASAAAPASRPTPAPPAGGPRPACPKCTSGETERGSVIGWYCRVCGWRENRG